MQQNERKEEKENEDVNNLLEFMTTLNIISNRTQSHLQQAYDFYTQMYTLYNTYNQTNSNSNQLIFQSIHSFSRALDEYEEKNDGIEEKSAYYDDILFEMIGDEKACSVCLQDYNESDEIVLTTCNHMYHKRCINNWLEQNKSCPVCRHRF